MENAYKKILNSMPDSGGYTYRKILRVDLERNSCVVLKSDPEGWQPEEECLAEQLERFARGGEIHREDRERLVAFTRMEFLRSGLESGKELLTLIYRRQVGEQWRWNLMEVVPDRSEEGHRAILCVKDVHEVFQEGLEREGMTARLQALEDRAYIISSLSTLFFSMYYLNLEQDTFRPVNQLRRVESVLGDEVNCTAGFQLYASHFVHPEDKAEYLRVMNVRNLRQSLRWWQPQVAVEYRRLEENPRNGNEWSWVRATAVLARTGTDDMPCTAVYVAQDISSGRSKSV